MNMLESNDTIMLLSCRQTQKVFSKIILHVFDEPKYNSASFIWYQ